MAKLPLIKIDEDSVGVVLPEDVIARLDAREGDELFLTEEPQGFRLRSARTETARQIEIAREITWRRSDALRKLAE